MKPRPRVIDLFCGAAGGWSVGLARAGFETVAACEIDPWRREVFQAQHPKARLYDDVRTLSAARLRADLGYLPDIVVGSPPCQEVSAANSKAAGITSDHLFWEWARLVFEIRPLWCGAENSPRARTRGLDGILAALARGRYAAWPQVVGAEHAGANHRRKRVWLIAADADRLDLAAGRALWRPARQGRADTGGRDAADAHEIDRQDAAAGASEEGPQASGRGAGRRMVGPAGPLGADAADAGSEPGTPIRHLQPGQSDPERNARHAALIDGLRLGEFCAGSGAKPPKAGFSVPDAHPARARHQIGPQRGRVDGEELPPALRDIGLAWPHWNGGLDGLTAACAAAGFGAVDDGAGSDLPAGLRNRAIAALGDAVVPEITEAIGRAMMGLAA